MEEDEKVPVSLPKGMQEFHKETGEPMYYLLEKPVYGMPYSSRRWSKTRDAWILEEFNSMSYKFATSPQPHQPQSINLSPQKFSHPPHPF